MGADQECRECGTEISVQYNAQQRTIAEKNIQHFSRLLAEEGEYLAGDVERNVRRIIYESELALKGEATFEKALCKKCRKRMAPESTGFQHRGGMSKDELDRIKSRGDSLMRDWWSDHSSENKHR